MENAPTVAFGVYSATKRYLTFLTNAINKEISHTPALKDKVDVCCFSPGPVSTNMTNVGVIPFVFISSADCAKGAIMDFGRYQYTNSTFTHQLFAWLLEFFMRIAPGIVDFGMGKAGIMLFEENEAKWT